MMIMANRKPVVRKVLFIASINFFTVSFLFIKAMRNVKNAPMPAASVGLKMPAYMPPMTKMNNRIIQMVDFKLMNFSFQLDLTFTFGARRGLMRTVIMIVKIYNIVSKIPGKMPAINS